MEEIQTLGSPIPAAECPLVRALEVVGERWTMLLLRQAFYGVRRFDEIQAELGISRKVLADRLAQMARDGLLTRTPYRDGAQRTRQEYRLTAMGRDLATALIALIQWSDRHLPNPEGRALRIVERATGEGVEVALVTPAGRRVGPTELATEVRGDFS